MIEVLQRKLNELKNMESMQRKNTGTGRNFKGVWPPGLYPPRLCHTPAGGGQKGLFKGIETS